MATYESEAAVPQTDAAAPRTKLHGNLGVVSLVFTVLAFNAPVAVAAGFAPLVIGFGNGAGAPATFALVGLILLLFSVGLCAMARYMRSPGAFYSYVVAGLGRIPSLGAAFLAITAYATIGITMPIYGGIVVKAMLEGVFGLPETPWWIWAVVLLAIAYGIGLLHVDVSAKVLGVALVLEIVLVLLWGLRVFVDGGPQGVSFASFTPHAFFSGSIALAPLFGIMCVTGFEAVAVFREETKDAVRTVPRATYASVIIMCGLYVMVTWAYLTAYGPSDAITAAAADPSGSFTASVHQYVGTVAADLVAVLLVTSTFACMLAINNIGSRYLYTLGSDGVFPRALAKVHPKLKSPHVSTTVFAVLLLLGVFVPTLAGLDPLKTYASTTAISALCLIILYTLTSVSVVVFFRRNREHHANVWQSLIAPVLAFLALATIVVLAITHVPTIIGGSWVAGGIALAIIAGIATAGVVLAVVYRVKRPDVYRRIGQQDI
jgi:amino acid transporter